MSERSERVIVTVRRHFGGAVIGAVPGGASNRRSSGTRAPISERSERIVQTLRRHFGGVVIGAPRAGVRGRPE